MFQVSDIVRTDGEDPNFATEWPHTHEPGPPALIRRIPKLASPSPPCCSTSCPMSTPPRRRRARVGLPTRRTGYGHSVLPIRDAAQRLPRRRLHDALCQRGVRPIRVPSRGSGAGRAGGPGGHALLPPHAGGRRPGDHHAVGRTGRTQSVAAASTARIVTAVVSGSAKHLYRA